MGSSRSSSAARIVPEAPCGDGSPDEHPNIKLSMAYQAQFLARLLQNDYLSRIGDTGVAPAQSYVLGELWFNEPLSQVELARRLDIGKATVGQTLSRLERAGLIERRRLPGDRRVIMIHLTEQGRAMREPLTRAAGEQSQQIEQRLGRDNVERLTQLMLHATSILSINAVEDISVE